MIRPRQHSSDLDKFHVGRLRYEITIGPHGCKMLCQCLSNEMFSLL